MPIIVLGQFPSIAIVLLNLDIASLLFPVVRSHPQRVDVPLQHLGVPVPSVYPVKWNNKGELFNEHIYYYNNVMRKKKAMVES
ncbi:hypothetical protein [Aerosakkonema funiforme]|uniref:hypothetical protein n=1 Tax=Aerosakkonema funiforme TaxID=1246630 RepID=UPI001682669E|nr:hypothetical protein [Aerosakkonema funiforme]